MTFFHARLRRLPILSSLRFLIFTSLALASLVGPASAQSLAARSSQNVLIYFENDMFGGTDQHYTNGVKATWLSPDLTSYADDPRLPGWAHELIGAVPYMQDKTTIKNVGLSIGQNIYTPAIRDRKDLLEDDRPYAGWLYFSMALHNKNREKLDTLELSVGMVGPSSLAEQTQNGVHDTFNIGRAEGWDNQLKDEPGVILAYQRTWRLMVPGSERGLGLDFLPHVGAAAGNVSTFANAGGEIRLGWNLPGDFGTSLIRPGGGVGAPTDDNDPRFDEKGGFGFHVFAGADGRLVGRNIFLDGNTWKDSHSVEKNYGVADLSFGASLIWRAFKLTYSQVYRTEEYVGQDGGQTFGSLSLDYTF